MKVVPEALRTKGRQVTYIVQGESAKAATFVYNSNKVTDEGFLINRNNVDVEPITILGSCYVMPLYTFNNPPVIQKPISLRDYQNLADPDDNTEYLIFE